MRSQQYPGAEPDDIHEVVRVLNANLGTTIVRTIAGASERSIAIEWASHGGTAPCPDAQRKLRLAYRVWSMVEHAQGANVALAWLVGADPRLGDEVPLQCVIEERAEEVLGAAAAFAADQAGS